MFLLSCLLHVVLSTVERSIRSVLDQFASVEHQWCVLLRLAFLLIVVRNLILSSNAITPIFAPVSLVPDAIHSH